MIDIMCSTTFDPESWSLFSTNLESIEFYNQLFAVRLVVLASGRRQGLTFYIVMICERCSFECDIGKYSTRPMNKV